MDFELLLDLDQRLVKRYKKLMWGCLSPQNGLSAGIKSLITQSRSFSQTQGAWRLLNNPKCTLSKLIAPVLQGARNGVNEFCKNYGLVVHDWSVLSYKQHSSKKDRCEVRNKANLGYELQSSLVINDQNGQPIAPIVMNLVTKNAIHSSYNFLNSAASHLEELVSRIKYINQLGFAKKMVHMIDREGDSVRFFRQIGDVLWLTRCRQNSNVVYLDKEIRVDQLAQQITLVKNSNIKFKGGSVCQEIGETKVLITRSGRLKKLTKEHKRSSKIVKGSPIEARFIVCRMVDKKGKVLAIWYLISNVDHSVPASQLVLWYYWRWSIESFFKLLKSAGMQLESWLQQTGVALARRLLIGYMACVFIWELGQDTSPPAEELRTILVRLSGRQMKYKTKFTLPALFVGCWELLTILDSLERYGPDQLRRLGEYFKGVRVV